MEDLKKLLAKLDKEQRKRILEYIQYLLSKNSGCRSWLIALMFASSLID